MKTVLILTLLGGASAFAGATLFGKLPRRLILGWISVGFCQSAFLLVIGFEFLFFLNLLFVVASATVLQVFSALFGTRAIHDAEAERSRKDWIYGIGAGVTMAGILVFALVNAAPEGSLASDLDTPSFAKEVLTAFPELPWILGIVLFLAVITVGAIGRPGWKKISGGSA